MEFVYTRKINYYETDKMGVVHHSNYIRFLEEARCYWLENLKMPFSSFEDQGITIPVLGVNLEYKHHVTFADTIQIHTYMKEYSGVRMVVMTGETKHCFTNSTLKPIHLKKVNPDFHHKFMSTLES